MVYFAEWDLKWKAKKQGRIAGALYYEVETEIGTERVYVPISEIRVLKDEPIIESRRTVDSKGFFDYKPIELREALRIAEERGGDFIAPSFFSESTYIVYKSATKDNAIESNKNKH